MQLWTVPVGVYLISVDISGGAGGYAGANTPGYGARVTCVLAVQPGTVLYYFIGSQGQPFVNGAYVTGGYNGGGDGYSMSSGGGASDIRVGGTALSNRVVVAGGGGGTYGPVSCGPVAGGNAGLVGRAGTSGSCGAQGGAGGTATAGGAGAWVNGTLGNGAGWSFISI